MSDGQNGAPPAPTVPPKSRVLFAIHEDPTGKILLQSSLSPPHLLRMLHDAMEDVRYQAFKMRDVVETSKVQLLGNVGSILKVPR